MYETPQRVRAAPHVAQPFASVAAEGNNREGTRNQLLSWSAPLTAACPSQLLHEGCWMILSSIRLQICGPWICFGAFLKPVTAPSPQLPLEASCRCPLPASWRHACCFSVLTGLLLLLSTEPLVLVSSLWSLSFPFFAPSPCSCWTAPEQLSFSINLQTYSPWTSQLAPSKN